MSIDHNIQVVHLEAPQDAQIAQLNEQLNTTYLPYGAEGQAKHETQLQQDQQNSEISSALMSKRARAKASSFYENSNWDLVDAYRQGKVGAEELEEYEAAQQLPSPMYSFDTARQLQFLDEKSQERNAIRQEIIQLSQERDAYLATKRSEMEAQAPSMGDALVTSVRKQAESKGFEFTH